VGEALSGKRVLVTGHSGFKGGWLCLWLEALGAEVMGVSLPPPGGPSLFEALGLDTLVDSRFADIRDASALAGVVQGFDAELVLHLAAEPIVRRAHRFPAETFATNVTGTANVLDIARAMPSLRAAIVVTSDKCYDNREWDWPYRETDRLGGADPYSASKACTEIVADCYRRTWFRDPAGPRLATVRAGNVIGGGDWAEDRLVPDIVRAASGGPALILRNPRSIRPWQHVLEPLSGYLMLAARMMQEDGARFANAWNFGPSGDGTIDVETLARAIMAASPALDLPIRFGGGEDCREAIMLRLDSSKAHHELGWRPRLSSRAMLGFTADWYAAFLRGDTDMRAASRDQLNAYSALQSMPQGELLQCG